MRIRKYAYLVVCPLDSEDKLDQLEVSEGPFERRMDAVRFKNAECHHAVIRRVPYDPKDFKWTGILRQIG